MAESDPRTELLERFNERRAKWQRQPSAPKRRFAPWLLLLNLIILGLMVSYHYRSAPDRTIHHTLVRYAGTAYRLTITHDESAKTIDVTLTMKNERAIPQRLFFLDPVAVATFRHDEATVLSVPLGAGTRDLSIKPNDSRVFTVRLGEAYLRSFAEANPDAIVPRRRTLFSAKRHIPLAVELSLRTRDALAAYLDFKYVIE